MSQTVENIIQQVLDIYDRWIKKELRLFPILAAYTYFMNIDPIVGIVLKTCRNIDNVTEIKNDLSTVRKLVYIAAQEDYESMIIRDITFVDKVKSEVCRRLSDKYCSEYIRLLREYIERSDVQDRVKLGVIARVFDKQRLLEETITRINIRYDLLQGWVRGFTDALQDLEQRVNLSKLRDVLLNIDLYELVNIKIPIGYATADTIIYPTCLDDIVNNIVHEYANAQKIIELCPRQD